MSDFGRYLLNIAARVALALAGVFVIAFFAYDFEIVSSFEDGWSLGAFIVLVYLVLDIIRQGYDIIERKI